MFTQLIHAFLLRRGASREKRSKPREKRSTSCRTWSYLLSFPRGALVSLLFIKASQKVSLGVRSLLDGPRFCNHGQHRLRAQDVAHARFKPKNHNNESTLLKLSSKIDILRFLPFLHPRLTLETYRSYASPRDTGPF